MSYSAGEELDSKVGSRYSLVIAVAKRAKQLREGQPRMVDCKSKNSITIALEEISAGKLQVILPTEEEILAAERHTTPPDRSHIDASELLKVPETLEGLDDVEAVLAAEEVADTELDDADSVAELSDEAETAEESMAAVEVEEAASSEADSADNISEE
jgi:DNA-directed RNA polymerase subunit omega